MQAKRDFSDCKTIRDRNAFAKEFLAGSKDFDQFWAQSEHYLMIAAMEYLSEHAESADPTEREIATKLGGQTTQGLYALLASNKNEEAMHRIFSEWEEKHPDSNACECYGVFVISCARTTANEVVTSLLTRLQEAA